MADTCFTAGAAAGAPDYTKFYFTITFCVDIPNLLLFYILAMCNCLAIYFSCSSRFVSSSTDAFLLAALSRLPSSITYWTYGSIFGVTESLPWLTAALLNSFFDLNKQGESLLTLADCSDVSSSKDSVLTNRELFYFGNLGCFCLCTGKSLTEMESSIDSLFLFFSFFY